MISGRRIWTDFKAFSKGYLRNKFGLFFGLVFPVILILIFGAIFSGGGSGTLYIYTQNQDDGAISTQYLDAINQTGTLQVITVDVSGNFTDYLSKNAIENGMIIPSDFSAAYRAGQPVNVTVYIIIHSMQPVHSSAEMDA
jgi:ABC-2 type transport system permease protein